MSTTQLYRESKLGDSLVDALDDLITAEKITPTLAMRILDQFDQARFPAITLAMSPSGKDSSGHGEGKCLQK